MPALHIRSVLVTGSSRGIGLEFVKQFLKLDSPPEKIFASCRNPDAPQSKELKGLAEKHANVVVIKLETTDPASVKEAANEVEKELKGAGLSVLVNNAGILTTGTLETLNSEEMLSVYNTNVVGPMLVTQAFHPLLKKAAQEDKSKSAIIDISALLGSITDLLNMYTAFPVIAYRCSKAALNMLSRCHAESYKQDGILSIAIHPGWVQTDMGGIQATLTTEASVGSMMKIILSLSEKQSGTFVNWDGQVLPW